MSRCCENLEADETGSGPDLDLVSMMAGGIGSEGAEVDWDSSDRRPTLEWSLVGAVLLIGLLWVGMTQHHSAVLHLFFLPSLLGALRLGRRQANLLSLLSILTVLASIVFMDGFGHRLAISFEEVLGIGVWGGALGLSSVLVGTLSDARRDALDQIRRLHRQESLCDGLTGIPNRRAFDFELNRRFSELQRNGKSLFLVMVDVDHFKRFNDLYGHANGDSALRQVAELLDNAVRDSDLVARFGGEEFAVILPDTDRAQAEEISERMRSIVEDNGFSCDGLRLRITVSVGTAKATEEDERDSLIERADAALYASKQAGRNCCHFYAGGVSKPFGAGLHEALPENTGESSPETSIRNEAIVLQRQLPSRQMFNEILRRRVAEAQRYTGTFSLMLVAIDHTETFQEFGAETQVVSRVAEIIRGSLRDPDLIVLYEAATFAVLLPATDLEGTVIPAERLQSRVANYDKFHYRGQPLPVTVSIGLAQFHESEFPGCLLKRAVDALAEAQQRSDRRLVMAKLEAAGDLGSPSQMPEPAPIITTDLQFGTPPITNAE